MIRAVFVFAAMLASASVASAQGTSGTHEDQAACRAKSSASFTVRRDAARRCSILDNGKFHTL